MTLKWVRAWRSRIQSPVTAAGPWENFTPFPAPETEKARIAILRQRGLSVFNKPEDSTSRKPGELLESYPQRQVFWLTP